MSLLAGVCRFVLLLFKTGLKHYLLASINDENLGTKLKKILAPFGSRTGKNRRYYHEEFVQFIRRGASRSNRKLFLAS